MDTLKKKYIRIVSIMIVLLLFLIGIYFFNSKLSNKNIGTIHYQTNSYVYDIKVTTSKIYVVKKEIIECFTTPCEPRKTNSYKVPYKKEYQKSMNKIFQNGSKKEVTITKNNQDSQELKVLSEITKETQEPSNDSKLSYQIIDTTLEQNNREYKKRGYYIESLSSGKVNITVAMGEKGNGGHHISIMKVIVIDNQVQIYVEEVHPEILESAIDVITCPIARVELSHMPEKILVQSLDTLEELEKVDSK